MGVKTVDIDHIDETKMQAHVKVGVPNTENIDCDTNIFSLMQCTAVDTKDAIITEKNTEKDVNQSGLRKRNVKSEETSKEGHIEEVNKINTEGTELKTEGENELDAKKLFDPIKWFGVLVPGSLKQSQAEFRKSVDLAVNVGNLQTKLESLRKNYRTLLQLKKTKFSDTEK